MVYAKRPFGGPEQVLKYLARYTHRVAISNRRLISLADGRVAFAWKREGTTEGPDHARKPPANDRAHLFVPGLFVPDFNYLQATQRAPRTENGTNEIAAQATHVQCAGECIGLTICPL